MSFLERELVLKEGASQEFSPRDSLTLAPCWNTILKKKRTEKHQALQNQHTTLINNFE